MGQFEQDHYQIIDGRDSNEEREEKLSPNIGLHGGLSNWEADGWIRHVGIWSGETEEQVQVQNAAVAARKICNIITDGSWCWSSSGPEGRAPPAWRHQPLIR